MKNNITLLIILLTFSLSFYNCEPKEKPNGGGGNQATALIPNVNADSAYHFVQKQVDFGPRVPGTEAHKKCAEWFEQKLKSYTPNVIVQEFTANYYHGGSENGYNIIASINPEHKRRVMLSAHWDSRFMADQDDERTKEAILGADDGGSGVALLIEIARILKENPIDLGVDIMLWDAEDQGKDGDGTENTTNTWCIGSQYWTRNLHIPNYDAKFGILLDMVGSPNAQFMKEGTSMQYASKYMNKTWKLAQKMGYGNYFLDQQASGIIDDHYFINKNLSGGIPTFDIINRPNGTQFGDYWHTHDDDMDVINKSTLAAVGNVVLAVLYNFSTGDL